MKPTNNLTNNFPNTIESIKSLMNIDKDFYRLCNDFEETTEMLKYLKKVNKSEKTKNQIIKYKQLQRTLILDINNFLTEEK